MEYGKIIGGIFVTSIFMSLLMIFLFGLLNSSNTSSLSANQTAQLDNLKNVSGYGSIINYVNTSYSSTFGNGNTNSLSGIFSILSGTFLVFGGIVINLFVIILKIPFTLLTMVNIMLFNSSLPISGVSGIIISYIVGIITLGLLTEVISYLGKWRESNDNVS